jgi:hypothetical protein
MNDRILPTNDLAFKKILASEDQKAVCCGFIHDFWNITVTPDELTIANPYSIQAYSEAVKNTAMDIVKLRQTILDVSFSLKRQDLQVEMQVKREKYFTERSLYYAFTRYCDNYNKQGAMELIRKGRGKAADLYNRYSSLRPVYSLNILDYSHFGGEDALRTYVLYDRQHQEALERELISISYFELEKELFENEEQREWRDFFLTGRAGKDAPAYIRQAEGMLENINLTEEERVMIDAQEKAQADYDASLVTAYDEGIDKGIEQGLERGIEQGLERGKAETQREMLALLGTAHTLDELKKMLAGLE